MARVRERVAPLDVGTVDVVEEQIHARHRVGRTVGLLPVDAHLLQIAGLLGGTDEQRGGSAGRVVDRFAVLRGDEPRHELGDHDRGEEGAGLLSGAGGELADHVLEGAADDVSRRLRRFETDVGGAQIEVAEILQQGAEAGVLLLRVAEHGLGIEVDAPEDAAQFPVEVLDALERRVDERADLVVEPVLVEKTETDVFLQPERQVANRPRDAQLVSGVFPLQVLHVLGERVVEILDEEHGEDVLLVVRGVDHAAEGVRAGPEHALDVLEGRF